jgi:hypothetical protein
VRCLVEVTADDVLLILELPCTAIEPDAIAKNRTADAAGDVIERFDLRRLCRTARPELGVDVVRLQLAGAVVGAEGAAELVARRPWECS